MLSRCFVLVLAAFLSVFQADPAASAHEVTWRVENGFRFYKTAAPFDAYRAVAEDQRKSGTKDWILRTEQKLQHDSDWNGWAFRSQEETCWERTGYVLINENLCEDYTMPASHRVLLSVTQTNDELDKCTVVVSPDPVPAFHGDDDGRRRQLYAQRRKKIEGRQANVSCKNIPIEVPFDATDNKGVEVKVSIVGGSTPESSPLVKIAITDLLVLGMGDSFAAGVGNPDRPAQLRIDAGVTYDGGTTILPVRRNGNSEATLADIGEAGANWLDARCFRSQYGPQFRTALHLASDLPHAAVTFLDLACDGARILEGLLHRKELDSGYDPNTPDPESQVGVASRLLCSAKRYETVAYRLRFADEAGKCPSARPNEICEYSDRKYQREEISQTSMRVCDPAGPNPFRRKIDVMLLSIGGNDIGFAPMVGNVLLGDTKLSDHFTRYLATEFGMIYDAALAKTRLGFLYGKYKVLDAAIDRYLPLRSGSSKPIFLTAYPLPIDDGEGGVCGGTNENAAAARYSVDLNPMFAGFSAPPSDSLNRLKAVAKTSCLLNIRRLGWFQGGAAAGPALDRLTDLGKMCAGLANEAKTQKAEIDWQYEFAFLERWQGHGFCSVSSGGDAEESLSPPRYHDGNHLWAPPFQRLKPYASRQRWIRTPNDAFAISNWQTYPVRIRDRANLLAASTTSAMHPSAEGYASMADALRTRVAAYLCSERAVEFSTEPMCRLP